MQEISLNVLDLAQNSISAGATLIEIGIDEDPEADRLTVTVKDNGRGMTKAQLAAADDPFFTTRTTRKVGLGIPLFKMNAVLSGGNFSIESAEGEGTGVRGEFGLTHIDRMPIGDMGETVMALITANPGLDFVYTRSRAGSSFVLDTRLAREQLGDIPLDAGEVVSFLREYLSEGEREIGAAE